MTKLKATDLLPTSPAQRRAAAATAHITGPAADGRDSAAIAGELHCDVLRGARGGS